MAIADSIRSGLIARGLPSHVADAFIMNFQDESGLNPGINEANPIVPGSRGGFGLAQWTGPRRRALEQFASQRGAPASDTDTQLDFLMTELQGPESGAFQAIMSSPDTGSAAASIVNKFLRPAEQHRESRVAKYTGGASPSSPAGGARAASQIQPPASDQTFGTMAPMMAGMQGTPVPSAVADYANSKDPKTFGERLGDMSKAWDAQMPQAPRLGPMQGPGNTGNALLEFLNSPTAADLLMKKRMSGVA